MSVVFEYAVPLILLSVFGFVFCIFFLWFMGPRSFKNNWVERSIFVWGWATGNVPMGVTLLRIVDPNFKSNALDDCGMACIFISFIEIALVAITPMVDISIF